MKVGDRVMHRKDPTKRGVVTKTYHNPPDTEEDSWAGGMWLKQLRCEVDMGGSTYMGPASNWEVIDNESVRDPQRNQLG